MGPYDTMRQATNAIQAARGVQREAVWHAFNDAIQASELKTGAFPVVWSARARAGKSPGYDTEVVVRIEAPEDASMVTVNRAVSQFGPVNGRRVDDGEWEYSLGHHRVLLIVLTWRF